jgi:hypothetical protein
MWVSNQATHHHHHRQCVSSTNEIEMKQQKADNNKFVIKLPFSSVEIDYGGLWPSHGV